MLLDEAARLREQVGEVYDDVVERLYEEAGRIAGAVVKTARESPALAIERRIDRLVTSRLWGFPLMGLLFAAIFWITISGANVPSQMISTALIDKLYPALREGAAWLGLPSWLRGVLIDGMYLTAAWVVSVMFPPMAIFFPLFTLLEDLGYLPRVAFNLDRLFKKSGAHGKQALTMMMGYGCNAAGIIATRIIDSPRERLVAMLTNNFALCNGRWPTQILIATLFIGALAPPALAGLIAATSVVGVAALGVALTFVVSWALSRTILRGKASAFTLELPPYRPPRVLRTLYTSLIDRTIFVLWRAVVVAVPAGALIWLSANIHVAGASVAEYLVRWLDPFGRAVGLNGVILLAYVLAIPANEVVIPTVLMLTALLTGAGGAGPGVLFEAEGADALAILHAGGWTLLTAVNLMLFSLVHNPCGTTLLTIYKETGSLKWTAAAALLPVGLGLLLTFSVTRLWQLAGAGGLVP